MPRPRAEIRLIDPDGSVYPDAGIKGFEWSFDDAFASELKAGLVVRLEIIARVLDLRDHNDGARWQVEVLEVRASDE